MKRRIAFLINSLQSGGAERVVLNILQKLSEDDDLELYLILMEKNNFYQLPENVNIKVIYLSENTGSENRFRKLIDLFILGQRLSRVVIQTDIQVVQSHLYRANYVNALSKILGGPHAVQMVNHSMLSRFRNNGLVGKTTLLFVKLLYRFSDRIICVSERMKIEFDAVYKWKRIEVILNPFDIKKILKQKDEAVLKEEFIFKSNIKYIVSLGRLLKLKKNSDLIKALEQLEDDVEVVFLGDGEEKSNLLQLAEDLGLSKRIHFLGNVSNPFKYLNKSSVFVLCSDTEALPNVVTEAKICRVPIVSSTTDGGRELLDSKLVTNDSLEFTAYGILYPIGNIEKLVEAMNFVLCKDSNSELKKMTENSYIQAMANFDICEIAAKYREVLIGEQRSPNCS